MVILALLAGVGFILLNAKSGMLWVKPGQPSQQAAVVAPPSSRVDNANQPWSQPIQASAAAVGELTTVAQDSVGLANTLSSVWQSLPGSDS